MPKISLSQFSGEIPRLISRLLPNTAASYAENVRLDDGGLTPVRKSRQEHVFNGISDIKTIFKHGSTWLAWDKVVHAVPGPVATDRLYYTGDGAPKMRVGTTVYALAVPMPSTALTVTVTGSGAGDVITRLYVYTWVTEFGEESEPCPISADATWQAGQTVTLSGFAATPTGRGITKQRIYRSQSSNQAGTDLFLIEERTASTSNYVDTHAPDDFREVLPSRDWNAPPDDLSGLISLPNGMMAAFSGKELCFCEPYRPHAWPEKYRLTASYPIKALAAYATTIVAGTEGYPFVASGASPDAMVEEKIEVNLPCVNGRGMVDLGYSAAYPSNDGLVVVSSSGANVATDTLFTRADWKRLSPANIISAQFTGRYFLSYSYLEIDGETLSEGTMAIDLTGQQPFVLRYGFKATAFHYDLPTGKLFYALDNVVYEFDAIGQTNEIMTWKSKQFVFPNPVTLGAILVESGTLVTPEERKARLDAIAAIAAHNATEFAKDTTGAEIDGTDVNTFVLNADTMEPLPSEKFISVRVYAGDELIRTVTKLDTVQRIKPRNSRFWEVQVNGSAELEQITLATTAFEIGGGS